MVYLAAFQGLRAHEIAKFKGEDLDVTAQQITVLGKGRVERTLPLHPLVAEWAEHFPRRGYWFPSRDDPKGHVRSRSVTSAVAEVLRRAGIPKGAAHRLRHTYATRLVQNGENLRVVQELLRHASLQTTQIYTGVTFEQQRAAGARLGLPVPEVP
jgi:site-specific recombinase XerD